MEEDLESEIFIQAGNGERLDLHGKLQAESLLWISLIKGKCESYWWWWRNSSFCNEFAMFVPSSVFVGGPCADYHSEEQASQLIVESLVMHSG